MNRHQHYSSYCSIMPPGIIHAVFTPLASVVIGGHFYCYDTMAATELAMRLDKTKTEKKTNNHHPAYIEMMARMVLALPYIYEGELSYLHI